MNAEKFSAPRFRAAFGRLVNTLIERSSALSGTQQTASGRPEENREEALRLVR